MVEKDHRYATVRIMLERRAIQKFSRIFEFIPVTVVCNDLGMNRTRFKRCLADPGHFTIEELERLADLLEYDAGKLIELARRRK